jgi:tRNA nucleotidyltransferase (CCA-adding enzyme)
MKQFSREGYAAKAGLRHESNFSKPDSIVRRTEREPIRNVEGEYTVYAGTPATDRATLLHEAGKEAEAQAIEAGLAVCQAIKDTGGFALFIGGCVRDQLWGKHPKDIDIEVYQVDPDTLESIIAPLGRVDDVGKNFGILKLYVNGVDLDISLPRTDSKIGVGHRGFTVKTDPSMSIREAGRRRDFTWNAISQDPITGEIFDPFGGVPDADARLLRITDEERFRDDPLRVMRAAQFIARFGLRTDQQTNDIIRSMVPELQEIARERMAEEWKKLLLKSPKPSLGLQHLMEWGVLDTYYPEIAAMRDVPQEFEWHPEGDVWVHTMMVVDEAAKIARQDELSSEETYELLLAALCHDMGKPETTEVQKIKGVLKLTSYGHEPAGVPLAASFLKKIAVSDVIANRVQVLVREHIAPYSIWSLQRQLEEAQKNPAVPVQGAVRKLARRVDPSSIESLSRLVRADQRGRGPFPDPKVPEQFMLRFDDGITEWLQGIARDVQVESGKPQPLVQGRDILSSIEGLKPGRHIGIAMRIADEYRDRFGYTKEQMMQLFVQTAQESGSFDVALEVLATRLTTEEE